MWHGLGHNAGLRGKHPKNLGLDGFKPFQKYLRQLGSCLSHKGLGKKVNESTTQSSYMRKENTKHHKTSQGSSHLLVSPIHISPVASMLRECQEPRPPDAPSSYIIAPLSSSSQSIPITKLRERTPKCRKQHAKLCLSAFCLVFLRVCHTL